MADIIIVGAGPAGLSAAIYARRAGMDTVCYEAMAYGGQIINTPEVENYPAIAHISGFDFAQSLYDQATAFGATVVFDRVTSIGGDAEHGFTVSLESNATATCKAVILAVGAANRHMGIPREDELIGKGISHCATCDGSFYKGRRVAVYGGGNTAVEDAIYLAAMASHVYLIHRRNEFRAEDALLQGMQGTAESGAYNPVCHYCA